MARDKHGDKVVPKVILEATHKDALVGHQLCTILQYRELILMYISPPQKGSDLTLDQLRQFAKTTEPVAEHRFDVGR